MSNKVWLLVLILTRVTVLSTGFRGNIFGPWNYVPPVPIHHVTSFAA